MAGRRDGDDGDSLFIPNTQAYDDEPPARRARLALPPLQPHTNHQPPPHLPALRASFDYRRPVFTSRTPAVIDLTEEEDVQPTTSRDSSATSATAAVAGAASSREQRPPRFGRDIIVDHHQLESESRGNSPPRRTLFAGHTPVLPHARPQFSSLRPRARLNQHRQPTPPSDMDEDIEIVSERALSPARRTGSRHITPATRSMFQPRSVTPYPGNEPIDLTNDDEVEIVNSRPRVREGGVNTARPGMTAGVGTRSDNDEGNRGILGNAYGVINLLRNGDAPRLIQRIVNAAEDAEYPLLGADPRRRVDHFQRHDAPPPARHFGVPTMMDFNVVGFDMGYEGGNRPASPKYEPPADPEPGFTRNPTEDEVVVCPNCGDELAMGEDELKQQIWVIKGCGHVSLPLLFARSVHFLTRHRHTAANARKTASARSRARARAKRPRPIYHHLSRPAWWMAAPRRPTGRTICSRCISAVRSLDESNTEIRIRT
jgi:hypothetical protein